MTLRCCADVSCPEYSTFVSFTFEPARTRVVFGRGTASSVRAEAERLGATRVLLIARHGGDAVAAALGPLLTARFTGAAMHTPVEVTERALASLHEHGADCLVSVGGGSSTGLSKALSVRAGIPRSSFRRPTPGPRSRRCSGRRRRV